MLRGLILTCLLFSGIDKNFAQPKSKKDSVVDFAGTLLGTKYTFGMQDPVNGFDCSGFVHYVFNRFRVPLPRASMDYERIGHKIMIDSVQPGDILVFTGTNAAIRHPGHVGIVNKIENKEITLFIPHPAATTKEWSLPTFLRWLAIRNDTFGLYG